MIEAGGLDAAPFAHGFGGLRLSLVVGVKNRRLQSLAGSEVPPFGVLRTDLLYRHLIAPIGPQ